MSQREPISTISVVQRETALGGDRAWLHSEGGVGGGMVEHRLTLEPDIAEIPRLLDWVEACCSEARVGGDVPFKLALVLEEAVANIIHHAFDGVPAPHRVAVELAIEVDRVMAVVIDNGGFFDPVAAPEPEQSTPLEERDPGGLGIHLIRTMMDRVEYRRVGGENRLYLEKARG